MKLLLAALVSLLAVPCRALAPGTPVTVTLPDGSVVNGVVASSAPVAGQESSAPLQPMGFNTPPPSSTPQQPLGATTPPQTATYIGVPVVPVQPLTRAQKKAFLEKQAAEREARKHEVTTPQSDWQFDLQQAIDRQAHGLPFSAPSDRR